MYSKTDAKKKKKKCCATNKSVVGSVEPSAIRRKAAHVKKSYTDKPQQQS